MNNLTKTTLGLAMAASSFIGLSATPAAAQGYYGGSGYYGYYNNGYNDRYRDYRFDRDAYRYNDARRDEWRREQWRRYHRHNHHHDNDWRDHGWRDHDRDGWRGW